MPFLTQAELRNQGAIALDVLLLQVSQKVAAAANHLQQAAAAVMIVLVGLQVLGEVVDARRQQRNLHLGGTGVRVMHTGGSDDILFVFHACFLLL